MTKKQFNKHTITKQKIQKQTKQYHRISIYIYTNTTKYTKQTTTTQTQHIKQSKTKQIQKTQ